MARPQNRSRRLGGRRRQRKKISVLTKDKVEYVDYKDVNLLRRFISDRAKIRARRVTGNNEQQQRAVALAIKNAREMALLPYENRITTQRRSLEGGRFGSDRFGTDRADEDTNRPSGVGPREPARSRNPRTAQESAETGSAGSSPVDDTPTPAAQPEDSSSEDAAISSPEASAPDVSEAPVADVSAADTSDLPAADAPKAVVSDASHTETAPEAPAPDEHKQEAGQ